MNAPIATPAPTFRRGTAADLDMIVKAAQIAYADMPVDWNAARTWASNLLANSDVACLIGRRTVGFMLATRSLWDTAPRAFLLPVFSLPGADLEPLHMIRKFAEIARTAGCATLEASSETTHDVGILLKRLGATQKPLYSLEL